VGINTLQYMKKPENLEVIELNRDNVEAVARWCGGNIETIRNILSPSNEAYSGIAVPSVYGPISAEFGSFIARNSETGKFSVMTKEHLENEYVRRGLRQDGIFGKPDMRR